MGEIRDEIRKGEEINNAKIFVNCTQCNKIKPPTDIYNNEVTSMIMTNHRDLTIPLTIGLPRVTLDNSNKKAIAIDIVFHPWVIQRCNIDKVFRQDVIDLGLNCLLQDKGMKVKTVCLDYYVL